MQDLVSSIKQLDLSEGLFSHEVVKGYPVGTLIWTDKMSLQKYVEIWIIVPLCTNAADLHPTPVLADGGKQIQVWICEEPKAAEYNPLVFLGIFLDQHASEAQREDFDSKIIRYTEAVEICKCQAGTGETCELLVNLPFECDHKGFFEPVSSDPTKAICLLTTQVPDPHDDENTYPMHMLILSLKALEKPIIDFTISQEDTTSTSQAKTWLQMHKDAKTSQKSKMQVLLLNQMIWMIWIRVS